MPGVIDPETMNAEDLPGIWSPVQWELDEEERNQELEAQATASLLWSVDVPEVILRLLLQETDIERLLEPPDDYDVEAQGEWDPDLVTFGFQKPINSLKWNETIIIYISSTNLAILAIGILRLNLKK